eukprot:gene26253-9379_t
MPVAPSGFSSVVEPPRGAPFSAPQPPLRNPDGRDGAGSTPSGRKLGGWTALKSLRDTSRMLASCSTAADSADAHLTYVVCAPPRGAFDLNAGLSSVAVRQGSSSLSGRAPTNASGKAGAPLAGPQPSGYFSGPGPGPSESRRDGVNCAAAAFARISAACGGTSVAPFGGQLIAYWITRVAAAKEEEEEDDIAALG